MVDHVTIEGFDEVAAALALLPDSISTNVAYQILYDRAKPVRDLARQNAPVGGVDEKGRKKARKGSLARSIIIGRRLSRRQYQQHHKDAETDIEIFVGVSGKIRYASMQEFGTHKYGPQSYMRKAWDQSKPLILQGFVDACWGKIIKVLDKKGL